MKKTISPVLGIGLIISVSHTIIVRFITPISNELSVLILMLAIILIIVGGLKTIVGRK